MVNKTFTNRIRSLSFLLLSFIIVAGSTRAGEPVIWETSSRAEILKGEARGVSVTDTGAFMLAPRFTQIFNTDQPSSGRARRTRLATSISARVMTDAFIASRLRGRALCFTTRRNWT